MPVISALWEARVGGSLEARRSRPRVQGQRGETPSLLKIQNVAGRGGAHLPTWEAEAQGSLEPGR